MIDTCSTWRYMTVQLPSGSWQYVIYCYRCTNVGFVNWLTSAAPWIACKGAFIQDPPHGVIVLGAISYHRRSNLLRIEGNFNSNRRVREVLQPEVVPFFQGIPGAMFQQDNARPHVAKTVRAFSSTEYMQLLP
ncbi:transposable element Tc1 transposase [Trichonephila clavipes]|nr:transposable element Tc1 transposase [Trichonephila clavipes]